LGDTDAFDDDPQAASANAATIPNVIARAGLIFICIATDLACVSATGFCPRIYGRGAAAVQ
jgi:hypothetical protein